MNKKELRIMYESCLLTEGGIDYIQKMSKSALESQLKEAKKYCNIPAKDAEDLLKQIQEVDFLGIERISPWEISSIPVLNHTGEVKYFSCCLADFGRVNKWGFRKPYKYLQIIYSDDFFVRWFGNVLTDVPVFWVSIGKIICRITYSHKSLKLHTNICREGEKLTGLDHLNMDNLVKKYHKELRVFDSTFTKIEHKNVYKSINLDNHFPKGFFYKGPKYNFKENNMKDISKIKDVSTENDLFRIEIENNTYPHSGWFFLDLGEIIKNG